VHLSWAALVDVVGKDRLASGDVNLRALEDLHHRLVLEIVDVRAGVGEKLQS